MKKLVAALSALALPAILAAWIALAPLGGALASLDPLADAVIAVHGRSAAVTALLMAGIGLAAFSALAVRPVRDRASELDERVPPLAFGRRHPGGEPALAEPHFAPPADPPVETLPEPRIPGLRRLAGQEQDALDPGLLPEKPAAPIALSMPAIEPEARSSPAPIALVRVPRQRQRDWFGDPSWLGGLPRLGDTAWPRNAAGTPLPFAAQIDLSEIAAAWPDTLLPPGGSLAFFLGTGAVLAVPAGASDFSDPPTGLPPAYDEGGDPLPVRAGRLSRWFFPFWPVVPVPADQVHRHARERDHPFYTAGPGAPVEDLWWHSVLHLADQVHEAHDCSARLLYARREDLNRQEAELARLRTDAGAVPYAVEDALETLEQAEVDFAALQDQFAALPDMIDALDRFVEGRAPWTALTPEEIRIVGDILAELHESYGDAVRGHVPGTLATLTAISVRAMVAGPADAFAALPQPLLARINGEYRLPPVHPHTMLGMDDGDLLLLQLGYDDLMEWAWPENAVFRFRISPQHAAAGCWSAAKLSFELA